ncbi:hypothetical protein R3P38DRAFT_2773814 [Favolaschia claudopus]|uniref:Uncharacterized protein n=1 Tax=Favolaschia claudopus TaxID=2862362 RepID=A0AAW0C3I5_9AGAR
MSPTIGSSHNLADGMPAAQDSEPEQSKHNRQVGPLTANWEGTNSESTRNTDDKESSAWCAGCANGQICDGTMSESRETCTHDHEKISESHLPGKTGHSAEHQPENKQANEDSNAIEKEIQRRTQVAQTLSQLRESQNDCREKLQTFVKCLDRCMMEMAVILEAFPLDLTTTQTLALRAEIERVKAMKAHAIMLYQVTTSFRA